jgi:hypothetical protein
LLEDPQYARHLARRAWHEVDQNWNMRLIARKLEQHYRQVLREKQTRRPGGDLPVVRLAGAAPPAARVPQAKTAS